MTHPDAEALAQRLTRVWGADPKSISFQSFPADRFSDAWFYFEGYIGKTIIHLSDTYGPIAGYLKSEKGIVRIQLSGEIHVHMYPEYFAEEAQFAAQWLPFFRRGCWLSGAEIDCTAHERVEWVQELGLTQSEAAEWGLKL